MYPYEVNVQFLLLTVAPMALHCPGAVSSHMEAVSETSCLGLFDYCRFVKACWAPEYSRFSTPLLATDMLLGGHEQTITASPVKDALRTRCARCSLSCSA